MNDGIESKNSEISTETEEGFDKKAYFKRELISFLNLVITVALATAAAALFRRSAGIAAMIPYAVLISFAAAFVNINIYLRLVIFAVTVFSFNTVESETDVAFMFTLLCLFAVLISSIGVKLVKKHKNALGISVTAIGLAASCALNVFFVGNPIRCIDAEETIDAYIESSYPERISLSTEISGRFTVSDIYYDHETKTYCKDAVWQRYPVYTGVISANPGDNITDGFAPILETLLAENLRSDVYEAVRAAFPDGRFTISDGTIAGFPDEKLLTGEEKALANCVSYEISLSGIQLVSEFRAAVIAYTNALDRSGVGYNEIVFTAGISEWYRQSATVTRNGHIYGKSVPVLKLRPKISTPGFDKFIEAFEKELTK